MILSEFLHLDCTLIDPAKLGRYVFITDPPYGEHVHARMTSCAQHGDVKGVRHRDAGFDPLSPELFTYLVACARGSSTWSIVYSDLEGLYQWQQAFRMLRTHKNGDGLIRTVLWIDDAEGGYAGTLPWIRWSSPQQSGDRPPSGAEALVFGHSPSKLVWGGPGNLTHFAHKCERGDKKHPTAKPLDQALDLAAWFTRPDETVYDPCAGRGTLGVACAILGRGYIGCEQQQSEAALGAARIAEAQQGRLGQRDQDRFERWLISIGMSKSTCPAALRGANFKKGLIA
jgi:hypothetical protein